MRIRLVTAIVIAALPVAIVASLAAQGQGPAAPGRAGGQGRAAGGPPVVPAGPAPKPLVRNTTPARTCESLKTVSLPDTTIDSAVVDNGDASIPASCRITAIVTHPPAGDAVKVFIALPMTGWNGRFRGEGGGGFSGGSAGAVRAPLAQGYAAGSTDTGHEGGSGSFALDSSNRLQWQLIRDNAYLGVHDMTVTGKALVEQFYGTAPVKSYWNGCSTGGRQGLSEAQRYPADYDGILAGAPAINWSQLHVEQMWATVLMAETKNPIPMCKYTAASAAAVAACDSIDGVKDGVIEDPARCTFDPKTLVGQSTDCGVFSDADATIIAKIWEGPRRQNGSFLWYGLSRGADFSGLSGTGPAPGGTGLVPRPNGITLEYWRYFLKQNPQWDPLTLTYGTYEQAWEQSLEQYSAVLGTNNPDLSAFRDRGGRIIVWHGQNDQLIYPGGSIDYYKRVQQQMGGADKTAAFIRLFLAPGVGHCGGGTGPAPSGQFEAVVRWVEENTAPTTLQAVRRDQSGAVTRSRPLCQYPLVARYKGTGSTDEASSFDCRATF